MAIGKQCYKSDAFFLRELFVTAYQHTAALSRLFLPSRPHRYFLLDESSRGQRVREHRMQSLSTACRTRDRVGTDVERIRVRGGVAHKRKITGASPGSVVKFI